MFVLTVDQIDSRHHEDQVPHALLELNRAMPHLKLPFERTVGDELQAALATASDTWQAVQYLLRQGTWTMGIGIGDIEDLQAESARQARGSAFYRAREAVEAAGRRGVTVPIAVRAHDPAKAQRAEAALHLAGALIHRRTKAGWEVADAMAAHDGHQMSVAQTLKITPQAVSKRLQVAMWQELDAAHGLITYLLEEAEEH